MNKIPVGAVIAQAFIFTFGGIVNLVRASWLPLVLIFALFAGGVMPALSSLISAANGKAAALSVGPAFLLAFVAYIGILILFFAQMVAVAQSALSPSDDSGWFNLPLGKPLWRLLGAFFLIILIFIGVMAGMIALGAIIGAIAGVAAGAGGAAPGVMAGLVALVIGVLEYGLFIFLAVRLGALVTPVVVAEQSFGIRRSWALSRGNFWRLFAVLLVVFLPFAAIETVAMFLVMPAFPNIQPGASPQDIQAAMQAWQAAMLTGMQGHWYVLAPVFALFSLLFYGLLASAQCFAYRALVQSETDADAFS
jgi:hypothetical protein